MSVDINYYATYVELQDIPSYSTNISVEGQLLKLSFLWNERIGKRVLSIKNTSDVVYLQNTILHPNEPLELNSNAVLDGLPYSVTLVKTGDQKRVGNIFNWSKDFILCFSRTVDVEVEKLNVVYGVTNPSTPTLPKPPPPYGDWILNQSYEIVGNDIKYTAYKTNSLNYYDSFALTDLAQALVKSFHDSDLQQYGAFTSAVEQLIGDVDWVLDPVNNQIKYIDSQTLNPPNIPQAWCYSDVEQRCFDSPLSAKGYFKSFYPQFPADFIWQQQSATHWYLVIREKPSSTSGGVSVSFLYINNPYYDPNAEQEEKTLPLETVAQQVISNADSSADEVLKLLSEDYINLVANSVFDSNTSKQFVKLEDLIPQLEANKVLRS